VDYYVENYSQPEENHSPTTAHWKPLKKYLHYRSDGKWKPTTTRYEKTEDHEQEQENENIIANDDISIKGELPNDTYVTINDINIVREMSTAQVNIDPETGKEREKKRQYPAMIGTTCDQGQQVETPNMT